MSLRVLGLRAPIESPSKVMLAPGDTSPQFESLRFGGGFIENLNEWFRRAPRPVPGPSAFKIAPKKEPVFGRAQAVALAAHAGIVFLIFLPSHHTTKVAQPPVLKTYLMAPNIPAYTVKSPPGKDIGKGGGGGGQRSLLPASKGRVPTFTMTQFVPPSLPLDRKPALVADASLVGPPDSASPVTQHDQLWRSGWSYVQRFRGAGPRRRNRRWRRTWNRQRLRPGLGSGK